MVPGDEKHKQKWGKETKGGGKRSNLESLVKTDLLSVRQFGKWERESNVSRNESPESMIPNVFMYVIFLF